MHKGVRTHRNLRMIAEEKNPGAGFQDGPSPASYDSRGGHPVSPTTPRQEYQEPPEAVAKVLHPSEGMPSPFKLGG